MNLKDRVAIVTGGGSGIGAAVARSFAAEGCRVVVVGRRIENLNETAASGPEGAIVAFAADVAEKESMDKLAEWTLNAYGRIDLLVNSAGTNTAKRAAAEVSPEDWDTIMKVNATGAFHCIRSVLPAMRAEGGGTIINISSVAGRRATPLGGVAYNASKFAMTALGTTFGEEEREHGIRVTNIFPGEVETPILDARPVPVSAEHRARILQPEDVADAVLMVATLPARARIPELVIVPTTQSYM